MFPKEHGAYGQLLFPLVTALAAGRPRTVAVLLTAAAVFAFLAHEPLVVLLGRRGARAARDQRRRAAVWFAGSAAGAAGAGGAALVLADADIRGALLVPAALAAVLVILIAVHLERTTGGEALTAVALSSLAWPIALAAGAPLVPARTIAVVFAVVFVSGTLGVHAVIAQTRRANAAVTRAVALIAAAAAVGLLWWTASAGLLAPVAPWAAVPVCALAALLAAAPPSATQLRPVGWTLVATTAAAAIVLIVALR